MFGNKLIQTILLIGNVNCKELRYKRDSESIRYIRISIICNFFVTVYVIQGFVKVFQRTPQHFAISDISKYHCSYQRGFTDLNRKI